MNDKTENARAPLCKICAHRHWNREPHVLGKSAPKKSEAKARPKQKAKTKTKRR